MYSEHVRIYNVGAEGSIDGSGKWIAGDEGDLVFTGMCDVQPAPMGRRRARLGENVDRQLFVMYFQPLVTPIKELVNDLIVISGGIRYRIIDVDPLNNSVNMTVI